MLLAHHGAYKLRILHRDLSHHNVLVRKREGETLGGVLIDWDLCPRLKDKKGVPKTLTGPHQHFRTGTWYFMSIELLSESDKTHLLRDDLESFLYLVLYLSLIWFDPVDLKIDDIKYINKQVFQQVQKAPNAGYLQVGGTNKSQMMRDDAFIGLKYSFMDNPALTAWLKRSLDLFQRYHRSKLLLESLLNDQQNEYALQPDDDMIKAAETNLKKFTAILDDHSSIEQFFDWALLSPANEWSTRKANVLMDPKRDCVESEPEPPFRSESIPESVVTTASSDDRRPNKRPRRTKVEKES